MAMLNNKRVNHMKLPYSSIFQLFIPPGRILRRHRARRQQRVDHRGSGRAQGEASEAGPTGPAPCGNTFKKKGVKWCWYVLFKCFIVLVYITFDHNF